MKLNIFKAEEGITAVSMISLGFVNILYNFDMPVRELLSKIKPEMKSAILDDIYFVDSNDDFSVEEQTSYLQQLNSFKNKLDNDVKFLACFEKVEVIIENIDTLERIVELVDGINVPIVLNICDISEDYILSNLEYIDSELKKNCKSKVSYLIKQCLSDVDAHHEDNSYTLEEVMLVLKSIREITNSIQKFNLSPLEQIMFIYDYVKNRYYKASDEGGSYIESRDIAKILSSDKIVCLGFATLFKGLLDNLNIPNEISMLHANDDNDPGHARNMVIVKDSKYNLDHILYFDATWDCKRDDEIVDENRYECFGRERLYFVKRDNGQLIEYNMLPYYLRKDDDYGFIFDGNYNVARKLVQIKRLFRNINWKQYISNSGISKENLDKFIYMMSDDFRAVCILAEDYDFCIYIYKECCKMLNREIPDDVFLKCLFSVRRVENYLESDKYSFQQDELFDIYYNRTMPGATNEQKFLFRVLMGFDRPLIKMLDELDEADRDNNRLMLLDILVVLNNNINKLAIDENVSVKEAVKMLKK